MQTITKEEAMRRMQAGELQLDSSEAVDAEAMPTISKDEAQRRVGSGELKTQSSAPDPNTWSVTKTPEMPWWKKALDRVNNLDPVGKATLGIVKQAEVDSFVGERLNQAKTATVKSINDEQNPLSTSLQVVGAGAGLVGDIIGQGVKNVVKTALPKSAEKKMADSFSEGIANSDIPTILQKYDGWKEKHPEAAGDIEAFTDIASLFPTQRGVKIGAEAAEASIKGAVKTADNLLGQALKKPVKSIDELIKQADTISSQAAKVIEKPTIGASENLLKTAEAQAPKISIREKWAGVRPDIKKQIAGKQEQLKTYFNVAHARNLDATLPTPLEVAKNRAVAASEKVGALLEDTGGKIGEFRQKIKTYQVPMDKVQGVMNDFDNELKKLNLSVKERTINRTQGTVKKISDSEMKLLQDFRENLNVIRQTPTVDSIIQNRLVADSRINFAKSAKEVSNVVDPIARKIRSRLAEVNRETIGKSEAKILEDYSNLAQFSEEFGGYMSREAGGEYLLKRVLSERGGDIRSLMKTLKEYTGIDLLDDSVMAQIATDIIGNADQKGLFRKEISKAGLDAMELLTGGKVKAGMLLLDNVAKKLTKPEKMFIKAAK